MCISVQKYLISNGAESTFNLGPEWSGPEGRETNSLLQTCIHVISHVHLFAPVISPRIVKFWVKGMITFKTRYIFDIHFNIWHRSISKSKKMQNKYNKSKILLSVFFFSFRMNHVVIIHNYLKQILVIFFRFRFSF